MTFLTHTHWIVITDYRGPNLWGLGAYDPTDSFSEAVSTWAEVHAENERSNREHEPRVYQISFAGGTFQDVTQDAAKHLMARLLRCGDFAPDWLEAFFRDEAA